MSTIFNELNYADGGSLSVTSATIGLLVGILGGMVAINLAVRKGWTTVLKTTTSLKTGGKGIISKDEQTPGSMVTINKDIIEPFAFHASLISLAILIGWFLTKGLNQYFNISIGLFVTSMLGGLLVQSVISKTKWSAGVDKGTFQRIQGLALEFLVASAVASIKIPVVIKYALPLIIQQTVMLVVMFWMLFWLCRRMFPENWFEHGIVLFGAFTGVVAIGLMLLRTVDPEMKTNVGQVFAARSPFTGPLVGGGALTALTPSLVVKYGALSVGLTYLGGFVILFFAMRFFGWWYPVNREMS
jgi:ESS family glutamate:Na+ symporter